MFDLDDFGVAVCTHSRPVLSWRESPETSLSDWVVRVVVPGRRAAEYHCHKTVLGVGPRSLPYFERIFRTAGLAEHAVGRSELELEASAADAMPAFLDFVYTGSLKATTASATAFLYLARYFHGESAFTVAMDFMQTDLSYHTAPVYLVEATLYSMEKVAAAAEQLCAMHCDSIEVGAMDVLPPPLFLRVMQHEKLKHTSEHLSMHVASFCRAHAEELDGALLVAMVPPSLIPRVHAAAALPLLHLGIQHQQERGAGDLIKRCVRAASDNYRQLFAPADALGHSPAAAAPDEPSAKRQRVETAARAAGDAVDASANRKLPLLRGMKLPDQVKIDVLESALVLAHSQLDAAVATLKATQAELQKQHTDHRAIMQKFVRVPKTASTECVKRSRAIAQSRLPPGHTNPEGWSVAQNPHGSRIARYGFDPCALFYYKA